MLKSMKVNIGKLQPSIFEVSTVRWHVF